LSGPPNTCFAAHFQTPFFYNSFMTVNIGMITIDCTSPSDLAKFWSATLDAQIVAESDEFVVLAPSREGGPRVGLQRVSDPHTEKNRLHLDIEVDDPKVEVERLLTLGANVVGEHSNPGAPEHGIPSFSWTVLTDPEGNQFCVGARL
jgi:hypothetical protein